MLKLQISKKLLIIVICSVLTVCITVGGSIAYLFSKSQQADNEFQPVFVSCSVEEGFDGDIKNDVKIRNTGDISAFVRATVVVMWTSDDGSVLSTSPVQNTDYSIVLGSRDWLVGSDGFYYFRKSVAAGEATEILISSLKALTEAPSGYHLSAHIVASAIQSEPVRAVNTAWGASVDTNGRLIAP